MTRSVPGRGGGSGRLLLLVFRLLIIMGGGGGVDSVDSISSPRSSFLEGLVICNTEGGDGGGGGDATVEEG